MVSTVLVDTIANISDLKKNPMEVVAQGDGFPVAILNRNHPAFYCVPAESYEALMERIEDLELNKLADSRKDQERIRVTLEDL